ncbi:TetR/AcrR family transcriptional regulator [Pseudonocardia eucalypti]|uniref:TetR/AcrR family transcriptional regulator n=1 Tax=Pseudonocardia eucalypti TaxID=648755 RepID=A0ABP9QAS2_9PSEU|nr:AcrR family transcriptional regulator [Pseudonocardia eucalypti]
MKEPDEVPSSRRELVEAELYEQASRLFAERGFAGTTLQHIADAMGITRPTLYYYVKSKEEILARLVTETTEGKANEVDRIRRDDTLDAPTKLRRISYVLAYSRASQPSRFMLLDRSVAHLPEPVAQRRQEIRQETLDSLVETVEKGITSGQFRPVNPLAAARAIYGMCSWVVNWYRPDGDQPPDEAAREITELAVAMVVQVPRRMPSNSGPQAAVALLRQDLSFLERVLDELNES